MGNCVSDLPKKKLSNVEQQLHDIEFVKAVKKGSYEKVYEEGGIGARLDQHIDGIPIIHYVILKGLSELDRVMEYDAILAYLICYTDLYNKKGIFDLSITINSHDQFHFTEGVEEFGNSNYCSDFTEIEHTPSEFCLFIKCLFDSDDYYTTTWSFIQEEKTNYVVKTLNAWYKYFKSIENNPNRSLCDYSTFVNASSNADMINVGSDYTKIIEDKETLSKEPYPSAPSIPEVPMYEPPNLNTYTNL